MILSFSFLSSIDVANDRDWSEVAGDDEAIDAVVMIDDCDCDWSAVDSTFASDERFSLEFWLIVFVRFLFSM